MKIRFALTFLVAALSASSALAHTPPKILTQFGATEKSDRTDGVNVDVVKGVHLYTGVKSLDGAEPATASAAIRKKVEIEIVERRIFCWPPRSLRTQGFYSGNRHSGRRFTHGFYSGY